MNSSNISSGYTLARYAARWWVNSSRGKIRLLRGDALDTAGAQLLVVNGPPNFLHAAAAVAALARPVRAIIPREACRGIWERWLASRMGVIWQGSSSSETSAVLSSSREAWARGEAVLIFAEIEPTRSEMLSPSCVIAAKLALACGAEAGLTIHPLHIVDSYGARAIGELLITAGSPIATRDYLGGASAEASLRALGGAIEDALLVNPYRLEERDLRFFLSDLEKLLRAVLEDDFAARPNWKQKTEGFEISRFAVEFVEDLNTRDPAALAGLRIELESYREELRRWSLMKAEVETAGDWLRSPASRWRYWLEAILEAPIAFYGFINHLIPIALLMPGNFVARIAKKDPGQAWLLRVLVVLGTYFVLVSICARGWGRAAAGYYTLTLPLSGLVLWRFSRLVRKQIRLLFLSRNLPKREGNLRRLREEFIERFNEARDRFVAAATSPQ